MIDLQGLMSLVKEGLLCFQSHPNFPLLIFNYTPKVQYERLWDDTTLMCRGLITDTKGNIVARPFKKFFNLEELSPSDLPAEPFEVLEKMDGSLGILYQTIKGPMIATRGSFTSDQSVVANRLLLEKYSHTIDKLDPLLTYLFEIIYPANRIVVDYGITEDLVLLAVIETVTGNDVSLPDIGFPLVKRYDGLKDIGALKALERENAEGFVVKFESGFRCKVKFADYVRLHRILTRISNVIIWEYLSKGKSFDELLTMVPDEFYAWVKLTVAQLQAQYDTIEAACKHKFEEFEFETRKEYALSFASSRHPAVLFKMLDKQPYAEIIWKSIKPKYAKAFAVDHE